jgi:predicted nucleotidyltransferase
MGSQRSCATATLLIPLPRCWRSPTSTVNRVDFTVGIRGLDAGAFSRAIEIPFHGERLRIIGLEDFVAMKLFANGPQDIADANAALAAAGDGVDITLLRKLAARFGPETSEALEAVLRAR